MTQAWTSLREGWSRVAPTAQALRIVHVGMLLVAAAYVLAFVQPVLEAHASTGLGNGHGRFLFDSIAYYETSRSFEPGAILAVLTGNRPAPPLSSLTNLALFLEGGLARSIFPWSPSLAILSMNYGLLLAAIAGYRRVAAELEIAWSPVLELVLVANPWVWLNMVSLTKEIWGLAIVAGFSVACVRRKWLLLAILAVVSALVREVYLLLGVGMGVIAYIRMPAWAYLVGLAGLLGLAETIFGDLTGYRTSRTVDLGQQMAPILALMGEIQSIPFGHVVAFPVVLAINVASPALNPRSYTTDPMAFYVYANTVSSFIFIALTWLLARRVMHFGFASIPAVPGRLLFAFVVLVTIYPISQHRYLLPALPLLAICALARPTAGDICVVGGHRARFQAHPVHGGSR